MTRQKEIDNAKNAFYKRILEDGYYYDPRDCFEEGAEWADAHPKSSWISVEDDLPCNHEEFMESKHSTKSVLAVLAWDNDPSKRHIEVCRMYAIEGLHGSNWYWNESLSYKVTHWMPLPKIPD